MIFVRPVMRDHLSWATAFAGQKGWSPKTGSTVVLLGYQYGECMPAKPMEHAVTACNCRNNINMQGTKCYHVFSFATGMLMR